MDFAIQRIKCCLMKSWRHFYPMKSAQTVICLEWKCNRIFTKWCDSVFLLGFDAPTHYIRVWNDSTHNFSFLQPFFSSDNERRSFWNDGHLHDFCYIAQGDFYGKRLQNATISIRYHCSFQQAHPHLYLHISTIFSIFFQSRLANIERKKTSLVSI